MSIIYVLIVLVIIGVLLWAVNQYVPMSPAIKKILNIVVIVLTCIWLLKVFGIFGYLMGVKV